MKKKTFIHRLLAKALPGANACRERGNEAGLTLVETIIVVGIIIAFTTSAILVVAPLLSTSKEAAVKNQLATFTQALEMYSLNCGTYPTEEQGLAALVRKPTTEPVADGWRGPYLSKSEVPKDPWGHEYKYVVPAPEGMPFGIVSYGADGKEGGEGDGKDIASWQ